MRGETNSSLWAIVPVKRLAQAKRRLAGVLSPQERADLMRRMTRRTLAALAVLPEVVQTLVISPDTEVLSLVAELGALGLDEGEGAGLNTAVTRAAAFAAAQGATMALILPADLPLLRPADLRLMLADDGRATICSDQHGRGTNALCLPLSLPFRFQYGPGSYGRHQQEAVRLGLPLTPYHIPNIQFDLDTEQDWQIYSKLLAVSNGQLTMGN